MRTPSTDSMQKKIRAVLVDDESLARRLLRHMLRDDPDVEVIAECANGRDAVAIIQKERPDLVFLDVQMPEMDGFSVLDQLADEYLPKIVFTTAYEQYAVRAFENHAIDYLLKPFDHIRFADMLKHAKGQLLDPEATDQRQLGVLIDSLRNRAEHLERLVIKSNGRLNLVRVEDINWLEANDKYVQLHFGKVTRLVRQTLNSMESQLDPKRFSRIHRSVIVNIDRIREIQPLFNGEYVVVLDDGTELSVSRHYKDNLFNILGKPL